MSYVVRFWTRPEDGSWWLRQETLEGTGRKCPHCKEPLDPEQYWVESAEASAHRFDTKAAAERAWREYIQSMKDRGEYDLWMREAGCKPRHRVEGVPE